MVCKCMLRLRNKLNNYYNHVTSCHFELPAVVAAAAGGGGAGSGAADRGKDNYNKTDSNG